MLLLFLLVTDTESYWFISNVLANRNELVNPLSDLEVSTHSTDNAITIDASKNWWGSGDNKDSITNVIAYDRRIVGMYRCNSYFRILDCVPMQQLLYDITSIGTVCYYCNICTIAINLKIIRGRRQLAPSITNSGHVKSK